MDDQPSTNAPGTVLRLLCSLVVSASGAGALWVVGTLPRFAEMFENMVEGGVSALPPVPRWLLENQALVMVLFAFTLAGVLWIIWKSRNGILIPAASVAACGLFILFAVLVPRILQEPLGSGYPEVSGLIRVPASDGESGEN